MKLVLLVNPTASSVTAKSQVMMSKLLSELHEVEILLTDGRGHATELAEQASKGEADAMIVFGGDGTLNEVANGLVGSDMALGVLPGGSTNVFSSLLGFSGDPILAGEQILDALRERSVRKVNLGEVNGRVFLFHAGIGFDAFVVERVERRPYWKRWLAHPLFVYKAFTTWLWHFDKSEPIFALEFGGGGEGGDVAVGDRQAAEGRPSVGGKIAVEDKLDAGDRQAAMKDEGRGELSAGGKIAAGDSPGAGDKPGKRHEPEDVDGGDSGSNTGSNKDSNKNRVESYFSVCLNANPYSYFGSRSIDLAPKDAGLHKELVVVSATSLSARSILRLARKAIFSSKGLENDSVIDYRASLESFRVYSEKEFPYQADGDFLGYTNELKFRHRPDSLRLIVPSKI